MRLSNQALVMLLLLLVLNLSAQAQEPVELRLLTYNIHTEREILDPMVAIIREADADIVGLEEVTEQAFERFEQEFSAVYPYRIFNPDTRVAMLSKYEIVEHHFYTPEEMRLLRTLLDVEGQQIAVYVVHPVSPGSTNYDFDPRGEEIAFLLDEVAQETQPVIMLGDFNTEEWSEDYAALTADFVDAFRTLHEDLLGATYPDYSSPQARTSPRLPTWSPPVLRIDYVFHDPVFTTLEALVWPESGGSDHRPLFVRLGLPPAD